MLGADTLARTAFNALVRAVTLIAESLVFAVSFELFVVEEAVVPDCENARDVYAVRTWHTVAASGASDLCAALVGFTNTRDKLFFRFRHNSDFAAIEYGEVVVAMLHCCNSREDSRHFWMITYPSERPIYRGAL